MTENVTDPSWQGAEATETASCEQLPARFAHGTDQHWCHGAGSKAHRVLLHTGQSPRGAKEQRASLCHQERYFILGCRL